MNDQDQYFHFTLGPVQSFVAQARRTRDFWAGSFLLSYFSAIAIKAIEKQGGKLIFPEVEKNYLHWLENNSETGKAPQQGCIPNRFKSGTAKVSDGFKPRLVEKSIKEAWQGLAAKVWENDLQQCDDKTKKIWDRQVDDFWEMSWVITADKKQSSLLDRRKNWRSYLPPEEQGVKCMMMDGWQELSGVERPNASDLKAFWEPLRRTSSLQNDLREGEYLCAIAFIKRRFSHIFKEFSKALSAGWTVYGWEVKSSVPSVSYMAAVPWMAEVIKYAPKGDISRFCESAKKLSGNYGKTITEINCLTQAIDERGYTDELGTFIKLEGDVFFESVLDNIIRDPKQDPQQAKQVKEYLKALIDAMNVEKGSDRKLELVSPFYAVLMMDGDSLGSQMSTLEKQEAISKALNLFTAGVAKIVEQQSGFLIYAGGDDVLALLPLEKALPCAYALRQSYENSFKEKGGYEKEDKSKGQIISTLSGAIEYAHIKMPLGKVLADAHHLLGDIAKEQYGRDSIAVRVWKPGGQHLQWAMPWKMAINDADEVVIKKLADDFSKIEQETAFSSSFFFNIEARFAMLQKKDLHGQWQLADGFKEGDIKNLIAVEYVNSGVNKNRKPKITLAEAKEKIDPLIEQCLPKKRVFVENIDDEFEAMNRLNVDAAHLVRFLATKGVDRG